jgi:hypothetical protein
LVNHPLARSAAEENHDQAAAKQDDPNGQANDLGIWVDAFHSFNLSDVDRNLLFVNEKLRKPEYISGTETSHWAEGCPTTEKSGLAMRLGALEGLKSLPGQPIMALTLAVAQFAGQAMNQIPPKEQQ